MTAVFSRGATPGLRIDPDHFIYPISAGDGSVKVTGPMAKKPS